MSTRICNFQFRPLIRTQSTSFIFDYSADLRAAPPPSSLVEGHADPPLLAPNYETMLTLAASHEV
jgi:hypothetical protein